MLTFFPNHVHSAMAHTLHRAEHGITGMMQQTKKYQFHPEVVKKKYFRI